MINTLKRFLSVLIIISSFIQLSGYNFAYAVGEEYKDPYKNIYISEYDGENYMPSNFTYRDGFGSNTQGGHFTSWKNVNFNETPVSVELSYGTMHQGAVAEIRVDSVLGPVIATFTPESTGSMFTEGFVEVNVQREVTGVHDLYFIFKNSYLNIKYFKFKKYGEDNLGYTLFEGMSNDAIYDDVNINELSYEIKLLNKLGMLGFIQETKFDGKKTVTKADFAQALCGFYTDKVENNEMYFYDLPAAHTKSKYVNYMYQRGIIEMTPDGHFRPEEIITVEQALNLLIKIYNLSMYDDKIVEETIKNLKSEILSGVSGKITNELTRQNLAVMLSNAIEASYISYKTIDGGTVGLYFTDGILKETRNIDKTYGLINAVPSTSLSNVESGLEKGEVLIGDTIYNDPKMLAQKYLGYNCVVYYSENNGSLNVEAIYPRSNVSEIIIDTTKDDELVSISEQLISYMNYDSNGRIKKATLADTVYFIYNGKAIDETIDKFVNIETFQGKIRIVNNKECTVVLIDEYQNVLLKCIDSAENKYLDRITDTLIDLSDTNTSVFKNSIPIKSSDIPAESAAYMYQSKNTIGEKITRIIILPDNKITGVVTSIKEETIEIDSEEYKIAIENPNTYTLGLFGTFIINTYNEIIWSDTGATDELQLGVFLGHNLLDDDETVVIKLSTNEGTIEKYECAERFILDGVTRKKAVQIMVGKDTYKGLDDVEIKTPVMYMLNEEKQLTILDTYHDGKNTRYDNLTKVGKNEKFRFSNNSRILVEQGNGYGAVPFETNSTLISYWAGTDETCIVIEPFRNQISSNSFPIGQAYSTNGNEKIANIFVWNDREKPDNGATPTDFILVDKVIETIDENDMPIRAITGYMGNEKVTRYISDQPSVDVEKINRTLDNLERGDYIYVSVDPKNNILDIIVNYFNDGVSSRNGVSSVLYKNNGGYYRERHDLILNGVRVLCKIIDVEDNYIFVRVGEGSSAIEEVYALSSPNIYKIYPRGIETGLSIKEVFNSSSYGDNAVVMVSNGCASQIVIYE